MQTKKESFTETIVNIVLGLVISFGIQLILFPLLKIPVTYNQNIIITIVFFLASLVRGYLVRRYFNNKHSQCTK
jgi:uncharacterized membrane protein